MPQSCLSLFSWTNLQIFFPFLDTFNGSELTAKLGHGKKIIGWIHSHVRGVNCFFSSQDVHTQYSSQQTSHNFFGIVMQINSRGRHEDHDYYKLTSKGMAGVKSCLAKPNQESLKREHNSCKLEDMYESIARNASLLSNMSLSIDHCVQFDSYSLRRRRSTVLKFNQLEPNPKGFKRKTTCLKV